MALSQFGHLLLHSKLLEHAVASALAEDARRNSRLALPRHLALDAALQQNLRVEHKAGTDLSQAELSVRLLQDLVVAEVDLALQNEKAQNVVDERLRARVVAGDVEGGREQRAGDAEVRDVVELGVEVEQRARVLEAVADHAHFIGGVDVEELELHRRPLRRLREPEVGRLLLAALEEDGRVAVVELAELLEVRAEVLADVEFWVRAAVGHDAAEILQQMAVLGVDGARADDEDLLDVAHALVGLSAAEGDVADHIGGNVVVFLLLLLLFLLLILFLFLLILIFGFIFIVIALFVSFLFLFNFHVFKLNGFSFG